LTGPNPYQPPRRDPACAPEAVSQAFTILDWIGVVVTVLALLGTCVLSLNAGVFGGMFKDLGTRGLPLLTRLVLRPWFGFLLALPSAAMVTVAVLRHQRSSLGRRRALVVVAFVLALLAAGVILVGLYQPIFSMAGAVKE
jgi:hypothetical protein